MTTELPKDVIAERSLLGAILLAPDVLNDIRAGLAVEDFYVEQHAAIFKAMCTVADAGGLPDISTVFSTMRTKHPDPGPLIQYLIELSNAVPHWMNATYYAQSVTDAATLRHVIRDVQDIAKEAFTSESAIAVIESAKARIDAISTRSRKQVWYTASEAVDTVYEELMAIRDNPDAGGIKTGLTDLDRTLGYFGRGDLIVVAARPAVGKTSFALQLAYNISKYQGKHVGIVSLEMSRSQLIQRILGIHSGIDISKLRTGDYDDSALTVLTSSLGAISALPLHISDTSTMTITQLQIHCRALAEQYGIDILFIDYLQLMMGNANSKDASRVQEVGEISRGLKGLARELNIPIVALSQLSRAVENRSSRIPQLSDLRESGSIEQDADSVLMLYRDELYDEESHKKGIAEVHIKKNRHGPTAIVPLRFFASSTRFANIEIYREANAHD